MAALIFAASSRSRVAGPDVSHFDKVAHFAVFGLLATLVCRTQPTLRGAVGACVVASAFGATDEWHQAYVPGREAGFSDWVADTAGAILATTLYVRWHWYRRLLEMPLWRRKSKTAGK